LTKDLIVAWEYQLPQELWTKNDDKSKPQEYTPVKIRWGSLNGYVLLTDIGKALCAKHANIQKEKAIEAKKKQMAEQGKNVSATSDIPIEEEKTPPLKMVSSHPLLLTAGRLHERFG
jgi:hypothetical protein